MLELAGVLRQWSAEGRRVAVATLISVDGSAPRAVGAALAVDDTGRVVGSISGGCVESELVAECEQVLAGGPAVVRRYGISPGDSWAPGLMCGGTIEVEIRAVADLDDAAWCEVERAASGIDLPEMVIVGAVEFAVALCALATRSGYSVTVVDHRAQFATKERFPDATAVVVQQIDAWCAERMWSPTDVVCVLGHDLERDTLVLASALEGGAGYVGAMGSRSTHDRRLAALAGVDASRLRSPIGLDLGGSSPEATAVSILGEVLAVQHGGSGRPLSELAGPIHRRDSVRSG